jgi:hypothetical protein
MISRTPTLAEWLYRMLRLACNLCPRRGQYCKDTLIARFGGGPIIFKIDTRPAILPPSGCYGRAVP